MVCAVGGALLMLAILPLACGDDDTEINDDDEKVVLADEMIDRYLAAWNDLDAQALLDLYAGYTRVVVPEVGDFDYNEFRDYIEELFADIETIDVSETGREVFLQSSAKATAKFRSHVLLTTESGDFAANRVWITWQLTWSDSGGWKIGQELGEDKISFKNRLLSLLQSWMDGWEALDPAAIVTAYETAATISEPDGTQLTLTEYQQSLADRFEGASSLAAEYLEFDLTELTWESAALSFRLRYNQFNQDETTDYVQTDYAWELSLNDNDWAVSKQIASQETDDDTTDDDTSDDDTTDDDTTDDDTSDDDTTDDDTTDDDTSDDDTSDDDTSDDDTTDDDTTDK